MVVAEILQRHADRLWGERTQGMGQEQLDEELRQWPDTDLAATIIAATAVESLPERFAPETFCEMLT